MSRAGAELIEPSGVVTDEVAAGSEMSRITDWLIAQGLRQADMGSVLEGFCQRLIGLGVPLWRGYVSARTLHPRIIATGYAWRAAEGISRDEYDHYRTPPQAYLDSPFAFMEREGLEQLRVRLGQPEAERFPLLREFGAAGATDYIAHMVGFGEPSHLYRTIGVVASWTSRAPAGFSTRDVGIIDHLMPRLALALGPASAARSQSTCSTPTSDRRPGTGCCRARSDAVHSKSSRRRFCTPISAASPRSPTAASATS